VSVSADVNKGKPLENISAGKARELIINSGLWTPRGTKTKSDAKEPARPKKSLIKDDFLDGPEKVKERALAIAKVLTSTVAKGRIGSLKLMIEGMNTFDKWWKHAPPSAKIKLFADAKHIATFEAGMDHSFAEAMGDNCPFRGSVPTPKEEEDEEE